MPAATKKAPAKKVATAKKAPAKAAGDPKAPAKTQKVNANGDRIAEVIRLREAGNKWFDIGQQLGMTPGAAMFLWEVAHVRPADRIKFTDDDDLGRKVVAAREQGLSWGKIAARTGVGEAKLKSLFEKTSGSPALGNRIGKGGRYPTGAERPEKPKGAPVKKAPAKAAGKATKKSASSDEGGGTFAGMKNFEEMNLSELRDRLNDKVITTKAGVKIGVKTVKSLKGGTMNLVDDKGATRSVEVADIKRASR